MSPFMETTNLLTTDSQYPSSPDRVLSICVIDAFGGTHVEKWAVPNTSDDRDRLYESLGWRLSYLLETQSQSPRANWTLSFYGSLDTLVLDFQGPNRGNDTGTDSLKTSAESLYSEMVTQQDVSSSSE